MQHYTEVYLDELFFQLSAAGLNYACDCGLNYTRAI